MPPFEYSQYRNPYVGSIAELMQQPGRAWAGAAHQIGQTIGAIPEQRAQQQAQTQLAEVRALQLDEARQAQAERDRELAITAQLHEAYTQAAQEGGIPSRETLFSILPPERALKVWQGHEALREADVKREEETGAKIIGGIYALPSEMRPQAWQVARETLIQQQRDPQAKAQLAAAIPEQYDAGVLAALGAHYLGPQKLVERDPTKDYASPLTNEVVVKGVPAVKPVYRMSPDKGALEQVGEVPKDAQVVQEPQPPRVTVQVPGNTGALTPEGVEFAATQYRVTGVMPPMGMGNSQARAAIINETAKQTAALRLTPVQAIQKQAAFKADAGSLTRMTAMKSAAEAFETKAVAQADIVEGLSAKVGRTGSPMMNAWLLAGKRELAGDSDTQLLYNAITTFSTEYAKIMEGSMGSVAASSDAARKAASELIKATLNKATLANTVALMKREMALTVQGYDATIGHITERMGGRAPVETGPATSGAPRIYYDANGNPIKK